MLKNKITGFGLLLTLLLISSATAAPAPFSFILNQFTLDGNRPGSIVENFNDIPLNSDLWEIEDDTVTLTGSSVIFSDPPSEIDHLTFGSVNIYSARSGIGSQFLMYDGEGSYEATSTWAPNLPETNQLFTMDISSVGIEPNDIVLMGVSNFETAIADFFGIPSGPAVFFGRLQDMENNDYSFEGYSLSPSQDEDIVLRIGFDDATDLFSGSFSLDGGDSFLAPFASVASNGDLLPMAEISLGGESWEVVVPVPSSLLMLFSGLIGLCLKRQRVRSLY